MARRRGCEIEVREGHHVVLMGDMEIWDGADLSLLRETLARLVDSDRRKALGVDLTFVKYIPSGFFGMLFDYAERGISVRVYSPQPHVAQMLWFREFFVEQNPQIFNLVIRAQTATSATERLQAGKAPWTEEPVPAIDPAKLVKTAKTPSKSSKVDMVRT